MSRTRSEKEAFVSEFRDRLTQANMAVLTDYRGVGVEDITTLRKGLRDSGGSYEVIKNSLAKIAAQGTPFEALFENVSGPKGLAYSSDDPVGLAKVLTKFAGDIDAFDFNEGVLKSKSLTRGDLEALSKLPSREVLIAKALGSMNAPIQNFHGVLIALLRNLVYVLEAVRKQKEEAA